MLSSSILGILLGTLLLITSVPDAASYTKYGRTCKDIGCRRDEVCVMAEDPCSIYQRDNCGRYPTCVKAHPGGASCASTICGENEYCKTENDAPTCVKKSTAVGYDSAGVSYVNGQRTNNDENHDKTSNSASNLNPYANANAPPAPADPAGGYHQVNSGSNLGYPAYPSNSASNSGSNSGYPPYPSSNQGNRQQDLGYPPYPTHNRMPVPGQAYPARQPGQSNYPTYPGQPAYPAPPGYPQQYPGYQNYPNANYPNANYPNQNLYPTPRPGKIRPTPPTPPPRSSPSGYGGRVSGNSGSRNTIGSGSIFNRLFGNDRYGVTTPRSRTQQSGNGYYDTHTSVDDQGNRIWRFFG